MLTLPAKGWGKGTEVLTAVQDCRIRRLTTKEALSRLESLGFHMSEAKFRRIKSYIRNSTKDRLNFIAYEEYAVSHIEAIDTLKTINNRLWEIVKEKKGSKEELKVLELIPNNIKTLVELYDSNPVVASISEKLGVKSDVS